MWTYNYVKSLTKWKQGEYMKEKHWEGGEGTEEGERKGDRKKERSRLGPNIMLHRFHLHKPT